jgi:hypothetical protein
MCSVDRPDEVAGRRGLTAIRAISLPALWAFVAVVLPIIAALEANLSSIDLAYQVRLGDIMLRTGSLIREDTLTFTALGQPWLDQQWGAQILFAAVHRAGGWAALALLRAALVGVIYLCVYLACRAAGADQRRAAWLTIAGFLVSVEGLALRPQLFGMVLFAVTVWLVFDRRNHPGRLWLIVPATAMWANLHGSFFLAPLVLALAWLADQREPSRNRTLWVGLASAAAVTLNPFGLRVWSYAVDISSNDQITRFINEWQPPTVRDIAGAVFFLSALVVAAILARRAKPVPWSSLLTLGVFFAIGLFAVRGIFWWALITPPVLAEILSEPQEVATPEERGSPVNTAIAAGLIVLAVAFLPWFRLEDAASGEGLLTDAPPGVTDALERTVEPGERVFNAQRWGSWLEFWFPENPVAVDSRIEVFPASVWRTYAAISLGQQGWQESLDDWAVDVVVAHREQQKELIPFIRDDPRWRLVYQDHEGLVFVRA